MELREAGRRIVGTHWRLIVLFVLLGVSIGALVHPGSGTPSYTASTRLVLDTPDPRDRAESTSIADTAAAIATSPSDVRGALNDAHIASRDPLDVASHHVSIQALGTSAVLELSVSDRNPKVAAAISNALAARIIQTRLSVSNGQLQQVLADLDQRIQTLNEKIATLNAAIRSLNVGAKRDAAQRSHDILVEQRRVLESERVSLVSTTALRPKPSIISAATPPRHSDSSHLLQDLILGGLIGVVLGVGLAGLVETIRPTFVGSDMLAREFDTPILGRLRSAPKARQRQRDLAAIAARLHLAANAADLKGIVLLAAGPDEDLRGLAHGLEAVPAEPLEEVPAGAEAALAAAEAALAADVPRNVRTRSSSARRAKGEPSDRVGLPIRAFDVRSSMVNGWNGSGLVVVSPRTLAKTNVEDVRHLLNATRVPLLGLITYNGSSSEPNARVKSVLGTLGGLLKDLQRRALRS
jgi:capsular polysaccharide biosynthesis protein